VLSAISSVVVARAFLGSEPLFRIPAVGIIRAPELLAYAVLGVVGGLASLVFAKLIQHLRPRLKAMPRWSLLLQPAIAGVLIGLIGWFGAPQVMGAGYEYIDQAMHDQFTWEMLGALAGLKILATTLSFVSGTPGGMFAPTLFIGAMLGGAVGGVERHFFPHLVGSVGVYALVGMGVLFAGFLRAPLTSVFMVLEVSGDYSIIVPVIIANTLAYVISRNFQPVPIFDLLTRQDGVELPSMEELRELPVLRVEDAMRPASLPVIEADELTGEAWRRVQSAIPDVVLVRRVALGWSVLSKSELSTMAAINPGAPLDTTLTDFEIMPHIHPDHPLDIALRYIQNWPVLAVIHRADPRRLEGVLSLDDVLQAYRRALPH
jgi:CIC family chloride channel protein